MQLRSSKLSIVDKVKWFLLVETNNFYEKILLYDKDWLKYVQTNNLHEKLDFDWKKYFRI